MSEQAKDLKPRTKAFALRVIRMYKTSQLIAIFTTIDKRSKGEL
jgi:hypothetical protein